LSNDALGNYVVVTPLLEMLRRRYPDAHLAYGGGVRTQELWSLDDRIDEGFALFGTHPSNTVDRFAGHPFDLVVNVEALPWAKAAATILAGSQGLICGPALDTQGRGDLPFADDSRGDLWRDREWIAEDITEKYPFLNSGFIGEMFCRLAYLEGEIPPYRTPRGHAPANAPDIWIAMSASLPEKLWPVEKWKAALAALKGRGLRVGLMGAPPRPDSLWKGASDEDRVVELELAEDWRGKLTLPDVAAALATSKAVLTLDNGIMHLAAAGDAPVVGLFRQGIHRLWTPPNGNVRPIVAPDLVSDIEVDAVLSQLADVG